VLIGFMSENIFRNVNVFRPFYLPHDGLSFSKPRFDIKAGEFILLPNPLQSLDDYRELLENPAEILPQLGSHDYFYQIQHKEGALANLPFPKLATMRLIKTLNYQLMNRSNIIAYNWHNVGQANEYQSDEYNPESNAFQVTTAIFDAFVQAVKQNNAVPVIVLFPNQPDAKRYRQNGSQIYAPLKAYLDQQQYAYIDTITLFADKSKPLEDLFKGHYSPLANQLVAAEIHRYLQDRVF
jgi:hypothetical protein